MRDGRELLDRMREILSDPAGRQRRGSEGRKRVLSSRGAAERYAEMVVKALGLKAKG